MNEARPLMVGPTVPVPTRMSDRRWRVNVLCLIGALLAVVSVFLVWVKARLIFWGVELNLIDLLNTAAESSSGDGTQVLIACILILVGTLLAILSPLGAILQLIGIPLFLEWFLSESEGRLPSGAGPYVAIAAAVIILVATAKPIGLGYGYESPGIRGRLLNFSRKPPVATITQPDWVAKYCKHCGRGMSEDAMRCPGCGRNVDGETPEQML